MMPKDFRTATRKLMHTCDGKECVNGKVMLTKQPVIEVLHTQNICQSRSACAENVFTEHKEMRDSQYDGKSEIEKLSTSMFEHVTIQDFCQVRKERGLVLQNGTPQRGFYLHIALELNKKRHKDSINLGMHKEEEEMLVAAVQRTKENAQSLTAANRAILWYVLDSTTTIYGHPTQTEALTLTY